jgi:hypothetical protein
MKATITQDRAPGFGSRMMYTVHFEDGRVVQAYTLVRAKAIAAKG